MENKSRKQLKRLDNHQIASDIKQFIKSNHDFYTNKTPELKVLAQRLHEEYKLKDFYKVFNKFWKSIYQEEVCLGIYTLQLYKEEFDLSVWKFIKNNIKDIKSSDLADNIGINIIGEILLRDKRIEKDIIKLAKSKNQLEKRIAIIACLPLIKEKQFEFPLKIIKLDLSHENVSIQKANSLLLKEIGRINKIKINL